MRIGWEGDDDGLSWTKLAVWMRDLKISEEAMKISEEASDRVAYAFGMLLTVLS